MDEEWVVLLEAAREGRAGAIDPQEVGRLLEELDQDASGGALQCSDRYALQVRARAASPAEALIEVLCRWADASHRLDLPSRKLVRIEVFTPAELERDFEEADRSRVPLPSKSPPPGDSEDEVGADLLRRAFSDPVTALLGREAFCHRVHAALVGADDDKSVAVVRLNLDRFPTGTDRLGGATEDEILRLVAERIEGVVRPTDPLARLGGVEYAVLLEDATAEGALAVAGRMLEAVAQPARLDERGLTLSASAGVALGQPDDTAQTLVAKAEAALEEASAASGGQVLYRADHPRPARTRPSRASAPQDQLAQLLLTQGAAVAANEARTLNEAARVVMRQICTHVGCDLGRLWVVPESGQRPAVLWHPPDATAFAAFREALEKLPVVAGVGPVGRVLATARPVWVAELAAEAELDSPAEEEAAAAGLHSVFAFPVLVGREPVAVLEFFSRAPSETGTSFLDVLASIGIQLGRVVERERAAAAMRRVHEDLLSVKESYQRIVENTHEGVWTVDADYVTTYVNPRMAQMLGYTPWEMTGMPATMFVDEETQREMAGNLDRRRAGASDRYEALLRAKDGSPVHVRISASPLQDDHGRHSGALAMVTEVAAERDAEEIVRLRASVSELESSKSPERA